MFLYAHILFHFAQICSEIDTWNRWTADSRATTKIIELQFSLLLEREEKENTPNSNKRQIDK